MITSKTSNSSLRGKVAVGEIDSWVSSDSVGVKK